jgi:hypothetical protein
MEENLKKIEAAFGAFAADAAKQAEKGNKAAGTRARKQALALIGLLKEFRRISVGSSR